LRWTLYYTTSWNLWWSLLLVVLIRSTWVMVACQHTRGAFHQFRRDNSRCLVAHHICRLRTGKSLCNHLTHWFVIIIGTDIILHIISFDITEFLFNILLFNTQ
jgi:hypothetical protein